MHLALAVAGGASPDRSVARFVRGLVAQSASVQLHLVWPSELPEAEQTELRLRWQDWLQAEALDATVLEEQRK